MATINLDSYTPNSNAYKRRQMEEPEKGERIRLDPIIDSSKIVSKKKTLGRKFSELFLKEDMRDIKKYVIYDVVIPGIGLTFMNIISMMFFGRPASKNVFGNNYTYSRGDNSYYDYGSTSYYDYRGDYGRSNDKRSSNRYYREDEKVDYKSIVLNSRRDAEKLVDTMRERIRNAGTITVAEFFDLLNVPSAFTDNDWGWKDERDLGIKRIPNGFLIDVSDAKFLR